jgi:hypothetical protein
MTEDVAVQPTVLVETVVNTGKDAIVSDADLWKKFLKIVDGDNCDYETPSYFLSINTNDNSCAVGLKPGILFLLKIEQYNKRVNNLQERVSSLNADLQTEPSVKEIIALTATLNYEDFIVERSFSGSLIFKLKFRNDILLVLNIPSLEIETQSLPHAVFTLLEKDEVIVNSVNSVKNIVLGMASYLKQ